MVGTVVCPSKKMEIVSRVYGDSQVPATCQVYAQSRFSGRSTTKGGEAPEGDQPGENLNHQAIEAACDQGISSTDRLKRSVATQ